MLPRVERPITLLVGSRTTKLLALGALAAALAGCGPSVGAYCFEAQNCEGGNDFDEEACNIRFDEYAAQADVQNCGAEFDAWFDCIEQLSRCNNDRYQIDHEDGECGVEGEQLTGCADLDLGGAQ